MAHLRYTHDASTFPAVRKRLDAGGTRARGIIYPLTPLTFADSVSSYPNGGGVMSYGERIRAVREARMLTQYELGLILGTRENSISRWERDDLTPKVATLVNVSVALGCALDYLAGISENPALTRRWKDPRKASATQALARTPAAPPVEPRPKGRQRVRSGKVPGGS